MAPVACFAGSKLGLEAKVTFDGKSERKSLLDRKSLRIAGQQTEGGPQPLYTS